jgi:exonuclease V gamma subunit
MGLPFKLKLKREPLGENELSMLPGGVVSPSVPKKSPISAPKDDIIKVSEKSMDQNVSIAMARPASVASNLFPSPAKVAMVTPTQVVSSIPATSVPSGVMTTVPTNNLGGAITGTPLL